VPSRYRNRKPPKEPKTPTVKTLLQKAFEWNVLLETGEITSQAGIARRENLTRARVSQVMKLLQLAPAIREHILSMPDIISQPAVTERSLRPIVQMNDHESQFVAFSSLLDFKVAVAK